MRPPPDSTDPLSTAALAALCERYWHGEAAIDSADYAAALDELGRRGVEALGPSRRWLANPDYALRETGAGLIATLAEQGALGVPLEPVVADLGALLGRPIDDDEPKSAQALDEAMAALNAIARSDGLASAQAVLLSDVADDFPDDFDEAIGFVETLAAQSFLDADDPLEAVRDWLRRQRPV